MVKFVCSRSVKYAAATALAVASSVAHSQSFPNSFTNPYDSTAAPNGGVTSAIVNLPNYGGNVLMSVFSAGTDLSVGISNDGNFYTTVLDLTRDYGMPSVRARADIPSINAPSIAVLNNTIYIGFVTQNETVDVVRGTVDPSSGAITWAFVHNEPSVIATTSPAMVATPYNKVLFIYGSSSDSRTKNAFYQFSLNEDGNWSPASETYLGGSSLRVSSGSRPGLAYLNGSLYLTSQQNNSNHQLFVYKSNDSLTWNFVVNVTGLAIGGDVQMITWNNELLLANQQNNSNSSLFLFASTDGVNWAARQYGNVTMYQGPGIAQFNNNLVVSIHNKDGYLATANQQ